MKIVATNHDQTQPHRISTGNMDVQIGATKYSVGRTPGETAFEMDQSTRLFSIAPQLDPSDQGYTQITYWLAVMAANPGAGPGPIAGVGFTIKDITSTTIQAVSEPVGIQLFDDVACTIPSVNAVISAVTTGTGGTVAAGLGTPAIEMTTAVGVVSVSVAATAAAPAAGFTCYAKAFTLGSKSTQGPGTHILDCHLVQTITFN